MRTATKNLIGAAIEYLTSDLSVYFYFCTLYFSMQRATPTTEPAVLVCLSYFGLFLNGTAEEIEKINREYFP